MGDVGIKAVANALLYKRNLEVRKAMFLRNNLQYKLL